MLLPKKMSIFVNIIDLMSDLKVRKTDAALITSKLPKKIVFLKKPKDFFILFL